MGRFGFGFDFHSENEVFSFSLYDNKTKRSVKIHSKRDVSKIRHEVGDGGRVEYKNINFIIHTPSVNTKKLGNST